MRTRNNEYETEADKAYKENDDANAVIFGRHLRNALQRFFWWAAGKSTALMQMCAESVRIKYSAIGLWLTGVVPVVAGFAMAQFLSDLHFGTLAVFFGSVFWSLTVVTLERILLTFPNGPDKLKNWLRAVPRFAIALCVSYLITETLICMAFNGEIKAEMASNVDKVVMQKGASVRAEQEARITFLTTENNRLKMKLDELYNRRIEAENAMHSEADGTGGTFVEGEGNHYQMRKDAFDRAQSEYETEKPLIEDKIKTNETELGNLDASAKLAEAEKQVVEGGANGLLAKHEALMRIISTRSSAATLYYALMLFLILIETIALLQKLIAAPDEYDSRLEFECERRNLSINEEQKRAMQIICEANVVQTAIESRILTLACNGEPEKLPEMERPIGKRVYGEFIQTASDEMTTRRTSNSTASEFSDAIRLEIIGHGDLSGILRLPKSEMNRITIPQLQLEFDQIGKTLSKQSGRTYKLERAENSLGLEIWPDSPLVAQLEHDRLARLKFGSSGRDVGTKPDGAFLAFHPKQRSNTAV